MFFLVFFLSFSSVAMARRELTVYQATELAHYGIRAPPRCDVTPGFEISRIGVPVPPVPRERRCSFLEWKLVLPQYVSGSEYWPRLFAREREARIGLCDAHLLQTSPDQHVVEAREQFWAGRGSVYEVIDAYGVTRSCTRQTLSELSTSIPVTRTTKTRRTAASRKQTRPGRGSPADNPQV